MNIYNIILGGYSFSPDRRSDLWACRVEATVEEFSAGLVGDWAYRASDKANFEPAMVFDEDSPSWKSIESLYDWESVPLVISPFRPPTTEKAKKSPHKVIFSLDV